MNDLIRINNDRIAGFSHAVKELEENDFDLKIIIQGLREESREYVHELTRAVEARGGDAETGTSTRRDMNRAWLHVQAAFFGHNRNRILEECWRGEEAIKRVYNSILAYDNRLPSHLKELVLRQERGIFNAHDKIKALRYSFA